MENKVLLEISARHVHLTQEHLEVLFGKGFVLTNKKDLSQPGQFASGERVNIVGPKKTLENVSVLGPLRDHSQIELSFTDARTIGLNAPLRESGDIAGSAGCTLVGPCGELELSEGVIVAKRHLHAHPDEAKELGITNGQIVSLKVENTGRALVFGDVVVRVNENYKLAAHFDTDEANGAGLGGVIYGCIV